jgi:hypothetical protein
MSYGAYFLGWFFICFFRGGITARILPELDGWQNKCRIGQGISIDANIPVKLPILIKHINGATTISGIPTGVISGIPGALDSSQHLFGANYSPPPPPPSTLSLKLPKYKMKITSITPSHSMEGGPM